MHDGIACHIPSSNSLKYCIYYISNQFNRLERKYHRSIFQANNCFLEWVVAEKYVKLGILSQFCLSWHYKVVCVHTLGEVNSSNTYCSAFIPAATCQIWWKCRTIFKVIAKITSGLFFMGTRCTRRKDPHPAVIYFHIQHKNLFYFATKICTTVIFHAALTSIFSEFRLCRSSCFLMDTDYILVQHLLHDKKKQYVNIRRIFT